MARRRKGIDTQPSTQVQARWGPIERFFGSYSEFQHNPSKPTAEEYQRLRRFYNWRRGDTEGDTAWSGYRLALVKEFNRLFGTDPEDLLAWQTLCTFVGSRERYTTCDDCVQSLQRRHFNIVDVLDARRRGEGAAQVFATVDSLREYTKRSGSYFPYDSRKAGKLLRQLLRKPRGDTIMRMTESPLFPPPCIRDGGFDAKKKARPVSSTRRMARSALERQMIMESVSHQPLLLRRV